MSFDNASILQHLSSGATSSGVSQTDTGLTREAILDYLSTPRPPVSTQRDTMSSADPYTLGQGYSLEPATTFTDLTGWTMVEDYNPGNIAIPVTGSPLSGAPSAPPLSDDELENYKIVQAEQPLYPTLPNADRRAAAHAMISDELVRPPAFNPNCEQYPEIMRLLNGSQPPAPPAQTPPAPTTTSNQGAASTKSRFWSYINVPSIFKRSKTQTTPTQDAQVGAQLAVPTQPAVTTNTTPAAVPFVPPQPTVVANASSNSVSGPNPSLKYPELHGFHFQIADPYSLLVPSASNALPPAGENK